MKRKILVVLMLAFCVALLPGTTMAKKKNVIRSAGGATIDSVGLVIDAGYDKRLDNFIPGYKVINVALVNQSFNVIGLDPEKDVWTIKLEGGRTREAIYDLRGKDPKVWAQIPERAKGLVGYPLAILVGAREVIDLFVPDSLDLEKFTELDIYIRSMDTKFEILVRQ